MIVGVVSPSSVGVVSGTKLAGYFRLPGVRHDLIVRTTDRMVIQHSRALHGSIPTRIVRSEAIHLDPLRIALLPLFAWSGP